MPNKRDQLVATALELFLEHGYHATGIDRIVAESGVAKMTLYNHFESKDQLIAAALELQDERWLAKVASYLDHIGGAPRDKLLAVFDLHTQWYCGGEFHGCAFIKASNEYTDPGHPLHAYAAAHYRRLRERLVALADEAGIRSADGLAGQLVLLLIGATSQALLASDHASATQARGIARRLIDDAA